MNRRPVRTAFAVALIALLVGLCVVEVAHAAMPDRAPMDCVTRLCDAPSGCAPAAAVVLHGLPVATVPATPALDAPGTPVWVRVVARRSPTSRHHLLASGPRSPPLA